MRGEPTHTMRSLLLSLLNILLLFTECSSAWQKSAVVTTDIATNSSPIPQFVLDTRHPWLDTNMSYLTSLENPKAALCYLNSSLRPVNRLDDPGYPMDLFEYLEINSNRYGVSREYSWKCTKE